MQEIIEIIGTNGIAVAIIVYFLYKDYKFNDATLNVLTEIQKVLASLKTLHGIDKEVKDDDK